MKKLLCFAALGALCLTARADDSSSDLLFQLKDGKQQSIAAQGLVMSINAGTLVADNGVLSIEIPLSDLQQFSFAATSAIGAIGAEASAPWLLYGTDGRAAGQFQSLTDCQGALPAGVYIAKSAHSTIKIIIR